MVQIAHNDPASPRGQPEDLDLELVLVDKNDTSWSLRPWLLLAHHAIPFTETSLVAGDPATLTRLQELSPTGKVPVLRVGSERVWESLAIIEALAELYPELPIWPTQPRLRRHARAIAAEMHAGFSELRRHCSMNLALRTTVELDPARRRELDRFERMVEGARALALPEGPFLFGAFCASDAMLAPVATRIVSYGLPVGATTRAWVNAIFGLAAFQRWEREAEEERRVRPAARVIGVPLEGRVQERVPEGPCYAAIFASQRRAGVSDYDQAAEQMVRLAQTMPGYLSHDSARGSDGFGITVSYWSSLDAIAQFRANTEHVQVQHAGRSRYYAAYDLRVARVERRTVFSAEARSGATP